MKVVITDAEFPDVEEERSVLEPAGFEVVRAGCRDAADVVRAGRGAVALLVQYAPVDATVLDGLPELRIVSRYGVGVDTVDLEAARRRGVWVANVPAYGTDEVALHATSLILALVRHVPFYDRAVREGRWHYQAAGELPGIEELTLGVVGMGRIGRSVCQRVGAWFGRVVGHDPYVPDSAWPAPVEWMDLADLVAVSDVVSLHLPLTAATRGLVDRALLARLKPGAYLVNTARGGLVVLDDLVDALDLGQLSAAALDVLPEEPPPSGHPVLAHPRVVLTPHVGWYSRPAELDLRRKAADNLVRWRRDGAPRSAVVTGRPA